MDKVNENEDGILFKHGYKGKVVSKYIVKMVHSEVLTSPLAERVACPQETPSLS